MKKFMKKTVSIALTAAMIIAMSPVNSADAAKKPALSTKKASINVGDTVKISVKYGKKSANVTWKSSNKTIAKITKMSKKGKKAYAKVKGIKTGTAVISASYKLGSKKTKLSCKFTVSDAVITPVAKATSTVAPATTAPAKPTATTTVAPTKVPAKPTATAAIATKTPVPKTAAPRKTAAPTAVPTATPTPLPADFVSATSEPLPFDSKYEADSSAKSEVVDGSLVLGTDKASNTLLNLPGCTQGEGVYAPANCYVIVYVEGTYTGKNGFALEVGNGWGSYLVDGDENIKNKQMVFPANHPQGAFSEAFFGKIEKDASGFAIKSLGDVASDGVTIKSVKLQYCGSKPTRDASGKIVLPVKK